MNDVENIEHRTLNSERRSWRHVSDTSEFAVQSSMFDVKGALP
jgi:hypothetical protein